METLQLFSSIVIQNGMYYITDTVGSKNGYEMPAFHQEKIAESYREISLKERPVLIFLNAELL